MPELLFENYNIDQVCYRKYICVKATLILDKYYAVIFKRSFPILAAIKMHALSLNH